jgi:hypothetical protein
VNDTVNGLPLPLLLGVIVFGLLGLVLLFDLDRTPRSTLAGWVATGLSSWCLVVALLVAVWP